MLAIVIAHIVLSLHQPFRIHPECVWWLSRHIDHLWALLSVICIDAAGGWRKLSTAVLYAPPNTAYGTPSTCLRLSRYLWGSSLYISHSAALPTFSSRKDPNRARHEFWKWHNNCTTRHVNGTIAYQGFQLREQARTV
jgi:hypothetical protein